MLTAADTAAWSRCAAATELRGARAHHGEFAHAAQVVSISPAAAPPFLGSNVWMGRFAAEDQSDVEAKTNPWFGFDAVGPDFFRALGVPHHLRPRVHRRRSRGRAARRRDHGGRCAAAVAESIGDRQAASRSGATLAGFARHGGRRRARLSLSAASREHADDLQAVSSGSGAGLLRRADARRPDADGRVASRGGRLRRGRPLFAPSRWTISSRHSWRCRDSTRCCCRSSRWRRSWSRRLASTASWRRR